MQFVTLGIVFVYFVLSGYTITETTDGTIDASNRIIIGDWLGIAIAVLAIMRLKKLHFAQEYWVYFAFLMVALLGVFGARNQQSGLVEWVVLVFNWGISISLLHIWLNTPGLTLSKLMQAFLVASTLLAIVGLLNFFIFPDMFGLRPKGGLTGSFRNTGQAGAFFGVALALAIPAVMSGFLKRNAFNYACLAILTLTLILTLKRAALVGFAIGTVLFSVQLMLSGKGKDRKTAFIFLLLAVIVAPAMQLVFEYAVENVQAVKWRFETKFNENTVEDFSEGFFAENLNAAMNALNDHPLLGAGLANIIGQYTVKYEIHSTYLSVLANTGVLGFAAYGIFMAAWIFGVLKDRRDASVEGRFLSYFLPFMLGLIVSWAYTYHIRKREFWILFFFVMACRYVISARRKHVANQRHRQQFATPEAAFQQRHWQSVLPKTDLR